MLSKNADFESGYQGKKVLVTGHTGFSGGWLTCWLNEIGAEVSGLSLEPETTPNLFDVLSLDKRVDSHIGDINDRSLVRNVIQQVKPEVIFHLAAQSLVSVGYDDPVGTFMTNTMGTLHVLEEARNCEATKAIVVITTDKVYENDELAESFSEGSRLGGKDPYSASKACAELVVSSYVRTMAKLGNDVKIATARGGNIIGGGDWAKDRIVPDFIRAKVGTSPLNIRSPQSTRPFQHVLSLVHGYLLLGAHLLQGGEEFGGGWNFGPSNGDSQTVSALIDEMRKFTEGPEVLYGKPSFIEAKYLSITCEKAKNELGWHSPLCFTDTVRLTCEWYNSFIGEPGEIYQKTLSQINQYRKKLGA